MTTHRLFPKPRGGRPAGRRLLLITGTPGTGKRPLAGYLAAQRDFLHIDLDSRATRTRFLRAGDDELRSELAALTASTRKVVVTWTFVSETVSPGSLQFRPIRYNCPSAMNSRGRPT